MKTGLTRTDYLSIHNTTKPVDTIFLIATLNHFAPEIQTKFLTFTQMKNIIKQKFNFEGKLTRKDIINHFLNYDKTQKEKRVTQKSEIIKDINEVKRKIGKVAKIDPIRKTKYKEIKDQLNKIKNRLTIAEHELRAVLREHNYIIHHDGTIEKIEESQQYFPIEDLFNDDVDIIMVNNFKQYLQ